MIGEMGLEVSECGRRGMEDVKGQYDDVGGEGSGIDRQEGRGT
jgi:hypothetical protein